MGDVLKVKSGLYNLLLLACLFPACTSDDIVKKFVPDDIELYARNYIETVRSGDLSGALLQLEPKVVNASTRTELEKLREHLNPGQVVSTELTYGYFSKFRKIAGEDWENFDRYIVEYYIQYSLQDVDYSGEAFQADLPKPDDEGIYHQFIQIIIDVKGDNKLIYGFHVRPLPESLPSVHSLNLDRKPFWQILFLIVIAIVPIFIIYTAWLCARTSLKRKWLWFFFILLGFGKIVLNWTTGQIVVNITSIQILGAGAIRWGLYGPWQFILTFPLGAVLFHVKMAKIKKAVEMQTIESEEIVDLSNSE